MLVEHERVMLIQTTNESGACSKNVDDWMKYVLCFEMLEMEFELHLVDQVWRTVREISSGIGGGTPSTSPNVAETGGSSYLPSITFGDVSSLLNRVLLAEAPTMRKLGLYRLLSGDAGVVDPAVMTVDFVVGSVMRSYDSIVG